MRISRKKVLTLVVALMVLTVALAGCNVDEVAENPSKVVRGAEEPIDFKSGDLWHGFVTPEIAEDMSVLLVDFPSDEVPVPGGFFMEHQSFAGSEGLRLDYGSCMFNYMEMFREDEENPNDFGVNIGTDAPSEEALVEWYMDELEEYGWEITEHEVKEDLYETVVKAEKNGSQMEVLVYVGGDGPGYERTDEITDQWDYVVFAMLLDLA